MAVDIIVPAEQEGTKAVVKSWLKKLGEAVAVSEPLVEIETDKVTVEIAAEARGVLSEILLETGSEVEPGTVLGRIADHVPVSAEGATRKEAEKPAIAVAASSSEQLSPGIRRLLSEHRLEPRDVPVRGEKLSREDVLAEIERRKASSVVSEKPTPGATRVPHDSMRRRIAEHMTRSVQAAPHVTAVFEADFTAIAAHRAAHKAAFAADGANLTFTAYVLSAAAMAMAVAPAVNGRWFEDFVEIYEDVNIGVGTALGEKGLIVPVIHKTQALSLLEIARRLTELTEKARSGKLAPSDVRDGTFSISNHGVSGSLLASPIIINQPQSAILGIGKLEKRAVVRQIAGVDVIEARPMAYVTLTIDHRAIDAYQTNAWLTRFVEILQAWK
jgi:2-oxoglutarate dehydrogenase E2 component (dihydrolipoamide succinyltransferase)